MEAIYLSLIVKDNGISVCFDGFIRILVWTAFHQVYEHKALFTECSFWYTE